MPEGITETGLELDDYNTILGNLQTSLNTIYSTDGEELNFGSETSDGQMPNIYA